MSEGATVTTRWFSLGRRLLVWLLAGLCIGWLAIIGKTYHDVDHEVDELLDAQLLQVAQTLLAMASEYEDDDDIAELESGRHKYQKKFVFQIWDGEQRLLLRSQNASLTPLAERDGFSDVMADGKQRWRAYSQWDREHKLRVQVAENHHVREEIGSHIVGRMLHLLLLGLPLFGAWIWFATRRGMAPVRAIADQVANRAPDRLDPLVPAAAPRELRPLLESLNHLFARVAGTLENERRFTADAAHELRTPLAAILAQAQVVLRARDAAEREHATRQLVQGAQRASHLVDQLLTLARLDPAVGLPTAALRFDSLVTEVCAEHGAAMLEKNLEFEMDLPAEVSLVCNAALLRILLRNLLDNAVRYTPPGGKVGVGVTADAAGVTLTVSDSGPGIPPQARRQVLRRFQRLAGQDTEGSGLGLSIVARIAELHGARLELDDGLVREQGRGLAVRVAFPVRLDA